MNKDEEIRILVARFMDGDTTLDEECKLYCYFSGDEVSDDLLPMREYFRSIAVMCTPKRSQYKGKPVLLGLLSRPLFVGIAASIALLVAVGVGSMVWRSEPQDYCEAYIYNRYVTSPGTEHCKPFVRMANQTLKVSCTTFSGTNKKRKD